MARNLERRLSPDPFGIALMALLMIVMAFGVVLYYFSIPANVTRNCTNIE
jgi:hypothetical protein